MAIPHSSMTMTTGTPLPAFKHDPLPEHTSHFRLLHIIRGDFGQHVECEISAWPIDNAPSYYAISYTWGDPADTTEITVNGRPLAVRRNCEYVLQQAFASKKSKYFWVDAICIAQTTEEKNHQVGIMGQIYSGAKHVLACVGPHENDSEFLPKIINEYRSLFRKIFELKGLRVFELNNPIVESKKVFFRCIFSIESEKRQRLYQSFCSFMRRSYFRRLWIIQELHLAQGVSFCFGTAIEAAEDFLALYRLLDNWFYLKVHRQQSWSVRLLAVFAQSTLARSRTKASQAMESAFYGVGIPSSLLRFACTAEKQDVTGIILNPNLQCSDPRDRLFGLLSVVGQLSGDVPKPDYTKDRFRVALEALKLIDKSEKYYVSFTARKLCRYFRVTGEEASLHNVLALRSSTYRPKAMSHHPDSGRLQRSLYEWMGFEISSDAEELGSLKPVSGRDFGMYVSAGEYEGCRSLNLAGVSKTLSISAPRGTRCGDWWLFSRFRMGEGIPLGLVVRKSEGYGYFVIGQTYQVGFNDSTIQAVRCDYSYKDFACSWYAEDCLLLGWILNGLDSQDVTQDQIVELVNRRICAWDGSSYFVKDS